MRKATLATCTSPRALGNTEVFIRPSPSTQQLDSDSFRPHDQSALSFKEDGSYVVEFRTADGDVLAISIPRNETAVIKHFRSECPTGCSGRTTPVRYRGPLGASARLQLFKRSRG